MECFTSVPQKETFLKEQYEDCSETRLISYEQTPIIVEVPAHVQTQYFHELLIVTPDSPLGMRAFRRWFEKHKPSFGVSRNVHPLQYDIVFPQAIYELILGELKSTGTHLQFSNGDGLEKNFEHERSMNIKARVVVDYYPSEFIAQAVLNDELEETPNGTYLRDDLARFDNRLRERSGLGRLIQRLAET